MNKIDYYYVNGVFNSMALFRRAKAPKDTLLPPEVQEYYKKSPRERTGIAWLLALATLIATLLIAAALFLGGRWAFNQIRGNDNPAPAQQEATADETTDSTVANAPDEEGAASTTTPGATGSTTGTSSTSTTVGSAATSTQAATNNGTATLVNTGPADTIALFIAVSIAATLGHYAISRVRATA